MTEELARAVRLEGDSWSATAGGLQQNLDSLRKDVDESYQLFLN